MKPYSLCLILFIITLVISKGSYDDFSIDKFKRNLRKEKLFDIIQNIKDAYGQDVAIISCEELNKNHCGNCQRLVKDYMNVTKTSKLNSKKNGNNININENKIESKNEKEVESEKDNGKKKAKKKSVKEILSKSIPFHRVNSISKRIIDRARRLPIKISIH